MTAIATIQGASRDRPVLENLRFNLTGARGSVGRWDAFAGESPLFLTLNIKTGRAGCFGLNSQQPGCSVAVMLADSWLLFNNSRLIVYG